MSFISSAKLVELVQRADPSGQMQVRIVDTNSLVLGTDPFNPTTSVSFSSEAVHPLTVARSEPPPVNQPTASTTPVTRARRSRRSYMYLLDFRGKTTECRSLPELLAEGLKAIEGYRPGTLDKLSEMKPRTKRIVARNASLLFEQKALAEKYSEPLGNGWWFGTNNSANETQMWLQRAAQIAGLVWNKEISTSL
jgi:hypothetical protein